MLHTSATVQEFGVFTLGVIFFGGALVFILFIILLQNRKKLKEEMIEWELVKKSNYETFLEKDGWRKMEEENIDMSISIRAFGAEREHYYEQMDARRDHAEELRKRELELNKDVIQLGILKSIKEDVKSLKGEK
jgi:hypothetical protein